MNIKKILLFVLVFGVVDAQAAGNNFVSNGKSSVEKLACSAFVELKDINHSFLCSCCSSLMVPTSWHIIQSIVNGVRRPRIYIRYFCSFGHKADCFFDDLLEKVPKLKVWREQGLRKMPDKKIKNYYSNDEMAQIAVMQRVSALKLSKNSEISKNYDHLMTWAKK